MKIRRDLAPASQLLLQHFPEGKYHNLLMIGFPENDTLEVFRAFHHRMSVTGYHWDISVSSTPGFDRNDQPDAVVLFTTNSHRRTEMLIAMATSILRKSGQIYVLGDNRSGIRTVKRHLEMSVAPIEASFSGKHCIMYRITPLKSTKPFCWWAWETMYETTVQKEILTIIGYPGVFSATHLDEGTQLLLENLQVHPGSTLLDLGCGTGVVGAYCARQEGTAQIMMADSDRFALAAAQRTAEANQLTNVTIQPSDGFSRIGDTYDHIICNPPFHQGRRLDHHLSIATAWFRDAARYLRKDGRITVCGNIFLPLGKLLKNTFRNVKTVAENRQYAIWEGSNPDSN